MSSELWIELSNGEAFKVAVLDTRSAGGATIFEVGVVPGQK